MKSGEPGEDDEQATSSGLTSTERRWVLRVLAVFVGVPVLLIVVMVVAGLVGGVWPPFVAVDTASMEPGLERGDMVYVVDTDGTPSEDGTGESGVVTAAQADASGYEKFGASGDVILYEPDGRDDEVPVLSRAMLYVEEGENWVEDADPAALGSANTCSDLDYVCPAPHSGYITRGDNNPTYDQVTRVSTVVKPEWVVGTGELSIPYLGTVRLREGS